MRIKLTLSIEEVNLIIDILASYADELVHHNCLLTCAKVCELINKLKIYRDCGKVFLSENMKGIDHEN